MHSESWQRKATQVIAKLVLATESCVGLLAGLSRE